MSAISSSVPKEINILCGERCATNACTSSEINLLNYAKNSITPNVTTRFDKFLETPQNLPDRIIDLLEIAAYVFCADRCAYRGRRESVNNLSWCRTMHFEVPVHDLDFWTTANVKSSLETALAYMTGDRKYCFNFCQASSNMLREAPYQLSLFSLTTNSATITDDVDIMLFSGGLDSLAGAVERLNIYPERTLCLINHKSNDRTIKAQRVLVDELKKKYNGRVIPYTFECRFRNLKSKDETQRTRMFLFSAIAYAICNQYNKHSFYIYENGVTSINLPKETDLINARASRTTHPKTIGLLMKFYQCFDPAFFIETPYKLHTKEDIARKFVEYKEESLIQLSVSCSSTRNVHEIAPHCGYCSQCIDRRFAMYAAGLADKYDNASYATNMPYDRSDEEAAQRISSTLWFASKGIGDTKTEFLKKYPTEILDVISYWPNTPDQSLDVIFDLFQRYSDSIQRASFAMEASFSEDFAPDNIMLKRVSSKNSHNKREAARVAACIEKSVFVLINHDETRQGSGFFLEDYGLVTSHHVTDDDDIYNVCRYDEYPCKCCAVSKSINELCSNKVIDYALYDVLQDCPLCFCIGDSKTLNVGDSVKVIAYPNFQAGTTYDLSTTEIRRITKLFQTPIFVVNSTVFHGASGGVVLNKKNEIVGLVRAGIESLEEEQSGIPGFVPIHLVIDDIEQCGK